MCQCVPSWRPEVTNMCAILHAFLQDSSRTTLASRSQSKARNTGRRTEYHGRTVPPLSPWSIPSLSCLISGFFLQFSLLLTCKRAAMARRRQSHTSSQRNPQVRPLVFISLTVYPLSVTPIPTRAHQVPIEIRSNLFTQLTRGICGR